MSYNTRRSGFAPSPNAVGQRRPPPSSQSEGQGQNYQSQLSAQNKPPTPQQNLQQQSGVQRPQQTNVNAGYRTQPVQQQQPQQMQAPPQQIQPQQQAPPLPQQQQPQPPVQKTIVQTVTLKKDDSMETDIPAELLDGMPTRRRPLWMTKGSKLTKRERQRRRNIRLHKMLQPKNALMILNELVKSATFTVAELPAPVDGCLYEASVVIDDIEMQGLGRNKHAAKSAAAEAALRHIVKYKKLPIEPKTEEPANGQESMEVTEEDVNVPIPWQHLASFALYKLFNSWGEDPDKARNEFVKPPKNPEPKTPKSLPPNAEEINPITLLNQMQPTAQYEEIGKSGNPPNVLFTMKCMASGENFIGTGSSKKAAKKMSAYAACHKLYGIQYPSDVLA